MNEESEFVIRKNEELRGLLGEVNIIEIMKISRLKLARHVWRSERLLGSITK